MKSARRRIQLFRSREHAARGMHQSRVGAEHLDAGVLDQRRVMQQVFVALFQRSDRAGQLEYCPDDSSPPKVKSYSFRITSGFS